MPILIVAYEMKRYSDAINLGALKRAARPGMSVAQVANDMGIKRGRIDAWRKRYRIDEHSVRLMPSIEREKEAEVRRLEREPAEARAETAIMRAALSTSRRTIRRESAADDG